MEEAGGRGVSWFAGAGIALGAALRVALLIRGGGTMIDDAYITVRYAQNLVENGQLVYNLGERVLGVSGPLYSLWVALHMLVVPPAGIGYALGASSILLYVATALAVFALLRRIGTRAAALAVVLFAAHLRFVDNSIVGMETPLFLLGVVWSLVLLRKGHTAWLSLIVALLMLVRPEGVLWAGSIVTVMAIQRRSVRPADLVPGAAVVLAWIGFSIWYYGSPIPLSVLAKSGWLVPEAPAGIAGRFASVFTSLSLLEAPASLAAASYAQPAIYAAVIVSVVLFIAGAVHLARRRSVILALPFLFVFYCAFYMLARGRVDFSWYGIPSGLAYMVSAVVGLTWIARALLAPRWRRNLFSIGAPATLIALMVVAVLVWRESRLPYFVAMREDYERVGEFIDRECPPDARVLVTETGMIGWKANRVVHEMAGIVSPEILRYMEERKADLRFDGMLDRFGTDVVVTDPLLVRAVASQGGLEWMEQSYRVLAEFPGHTVIKRELGLPASTARDP